jgi:zinc transport system substrate-binding protein
VSEADLVVYLDGFQPAVDAAVEENAEGPTLDAAKVTELLPVSQHGHEHEEEHGHDHGSEDPHFWHDPLRMAAVADSVAGQLAEIDPDNADTYSTNAAELRAELEALDSEYEEGLSSCRLQTVVVNHDAFSYLERYGLELEPVNGLSPDDEPNPATLAELADVIEEDGVTTVFTERLTSSATARTLATELDVDTDVLDPIEGLTEETADEDYLSLMRANLDALVKANGC